MKLIVLLLLGLGVCLSGRAEESVHSRLVTATNAFLDSLSAELRAIANMPLDGEERENWHYFPKERPGVALKSLDEEQRKALHGVLQTALSASGYETAETIRQLESVLRTMEQGKGSFSRDRELYYVTVFGEPSADGVWGLRYEGHHLSFNWTMVKGEVVAMTPQFLGSNPGDVHDGPMKGTRALGFMEDAGRALVMSLSEDQRTVALVDTKAPSEVLTSAERKATMLENKGIQFSALTEEQQSGLEALVALMVRVQAPENADKRLALVHADRESLVFTWMGSVVKGEGHYFRVQSPRFVIEYDNTQNNANHVHLVWRDFEGDFGRDILKEHYAAHTDPNHPHAHEH